MECLFFLGEVFLCLVEQEAACDESEYRYEDWCYVGCVDDKPYGYAVYGEA